MKKIQQDNLNNLKSFYVYVLECESNKYYVGLTADLDIRLRQHFQQDDKKYPGGGATFTEHYKPIRLVESMEILYYRKSIGDKPYDEETSKAEEYRKRYGETNVYGGRYRLPYMKNIWW